MMIMMIIMIILMLEVDRAELRKTKSAEAMSGVPAPTIVIGTYCVIIGLHLMLHLRKCVC